MHAMRINRNELDFFLITCIHVQKQKLLLSNSNPIDHATVTTFLATEKYSFVEPVRARRESHLPTELVQPKLPNMHCRHVSAHLPAEKSVAEKTSHDVLHRFSNKVTRNKTEKNICRVIAFFA